MKALLALLTLAFTFATGSVCAADEVKKAPSPAQKAQQEKMKKCNADAGDKQLKGDERKKFMSGCLSAKASPAAPEAAAAPATQQNKMKDCNAEAGEKQLKGDERKKFMSGCLKADKK